MSAQTFMPHFGRTAEMKVRKEIGYAMDAIERSPGARESSCICSAGK